MVQQHKFSKHEKLKSKKAIDSLFKNGKSIVCQPIRVVYLPKLNNNEMVNCGFAVPKKFMKLAVNRNLLKRRMREAYRLNNNSIKNTCAKNKKGLNLMFIYTTEQMLSYKEIEDKIKVLLTRLIEQSEKIGK